MESKGFHGARYQVAKQIERTDAEVSTGKIKQMDLVTGTLNVT